MMSEEKEDDQGMVEGRREEEIIGLIKELEEYDGEKGYGLDYGEVRDRLGSCVSRLIDIGDESLERLGRLLENPENWSCFMALYIITKIKSERSVPYLIDFIEKNEKSDNFEACDIACTALSEIGEPAVEKMVESIEGGLKKKIHYCYLCEALSKINDKRASDLRLRVIKDYLENPEEYKGWFTLTLFISDFKQDDKEALFYLEKLRETRLNRAEKRELRGIIKLIEGADGGKENLRKHESSWLGFLKRKLARN